jgi:bifunctional UDP-N-acetylglucosamine pyrophosphorylase/glucosamine-1-phosphate N-acetyltransferase
MENKAKIKVLIMAGGQGKRMGGEMPKVLAEVAGKPMIQWVLEAVEASMVDDSPTLVVGYKKELISQALGDKYEYVIQDSQLGTGHAVATAEPALRDKAENILILAGDNPFITGDTIKKLADKHLKTNAKVTMGTVRLPDFLDWRKFFYTNFSRIVRDGGGNILKSVEFKDATDEEKNILEVNPIYLCFKASFLWDNLKKLNKNNAQGEYYLTDLIKIATEESIKIESIEVPPHDALAANSKEELELLESIIKKNE